MGLLTIQKTLRGLVDPEIARHAQRFFKTGKGEYGEGDRFLGIRVPVLRQYVRQYRDIPITDILRVLRSPYHEERLFALLLWVDRFAKGGANERAGIYADYLANTEYINNWDLVDSSASKIVGPWLEDKDRQILHDLAHSPMLWERRISIIATHYFINWNDFQDALRISAILINDDEDLIHKAVGWMLREIGKRDLIAEKNFLEGCYQHMPRTMLRYAIEKFPEKERKQYLQGRA